MPPGLFTTLCELAHYLSHCSPFVLELAKLHLSDDGIITLAAHTEAQHLINVLRHYRGFQAQKLGSGLSMVIGYLGPAPHFISAEATAGIERQLDELSAHRVGRVTVERLWLVHYGNRTLCRIVGAMSLNLGRQNVLTEPELASRLGIADR